MEWIIAALAVAVLALAALAASGKLGSMPPPVDDVYAPYVPTQNISANDLRRARFGVRLRGYDMAQVDDLLDRLSRQLEAGAAPRVPVTDGTPEPAEPRRETVVETRETAVDEPLDDAPELVREAR